MKTYDDDNSVDSGGDSLSEGSENDNLIDLAPFANSSKQRAASELRRGINEMTEGLRQDAILRQKKRMLRPNPSFRNYFDAFENLTTDLQIATDSPVVSIMITYDSSRALTVQKKTDREYFVHQYDLTNDKFDCLFSEDFGSVDTYYIKMKDVEQNSTGDIYAACYIDDGHFKLRVFGKEQRSPEEALRKELDINKELHIDNHTIPIGNFSEPFITCTFITDGLLFVNLFHNRLLTHFHFLYEI